MDQAQMRAARLGLGEDEGHDRVEGAILGVPLSIWWCKLSGPSGVAWAVAVAECAVTAYQLGWLRSLTRDFTSSDSLPSASGS